MTGEVPLYRRDKFVLCGSGFQQRSNRGKMPLPQKWNNLTSKKIDFKSSQPPFGKRGRMV